MAAARRRGGCLRARAARLAGAPRRRRPKAPEHRDRRRCVRIGRGRRAAPRIRGRRACWRSGSARAACTPWWAPASWVRRRSGEPTPAQIQAWAAAAGVSTIAVGRATWIGGRQSIDVRLRAGNSGGLLGSYFAEARDAPRSSLPGSTGSPRDRRRDGRLAERRRCGALAPAGAAERPPRGAEGRPLRDRQLRQRPAARDPLRRARGLADRRRAPAGVHEGRARRAGRPEAGVGAPRGLLPAEGQPARAAGGERRRARRCRERARRAVTRRRTTAPRSAASARATPSCATATTASRAP